MLFLFLLFQYFLLLILKKYSNYFLMMNIVQERIYNEHNCNKVMTLLDWIKQTIIMYCYLVLYYSAKNFNFEVSRFSCWINSLLCFLKASNS